MRLLVVCMALIVVLFIAMVYAALAPECHILLINPVEGRWCFPDSLVA